MTDERKKVVIIGAGFAGLFAAKKLFGAKADVTVIDRNNFHTFNPLLYQVGAGEIEAAQIAYPVRSVFRSRKNIRFLMAGVEEIRFGRNTVVTGAGDVPYDYLVLASGSVPVFYGIPGAEENTFNLKSLDNAITLRNHILCQFEKASRSSDPDEIRKCLSFVVIGGGPTGVEFAGAFAELVHGPLKKDFPAIDISRIRVILLDGAKNLLAVYNKKSSLYTKRKLEKMGVTVKLGSAVKSIGRDDVATADGEKFQANTILWTAGVKGAPVKADFELTQRRDGRIAVGKTLQVQGMDNVFVCGDMAYFEQDGKPLPMMAPIATQEGIHAARNIIRMIKGRQPVDFIFSSRGSMVTIGRNSAIAQIGSFEMRGFFAWISWILIHIMYLIGFRNKLFVMISWFSDYIFFERSGRMIIPSCMAEQPVQIKSAEKKQKSAAKKKDVPQRHRAAESKDKKKKK